MRVLAKPIEMICWFEKDGTPHPVRFRIEDESGSYITMLIHKVLKVDKERLAGNWMYRFTCQGIVGGSVKIYEVKYELGTCKWILFKI